MFVFKTRMAACKSFLALAAHCCTTVKHRVRFLRRYIYSQLHGGFGCDCAFISGKSALGLWEQSKLWHTDWPINAIYFLLRSWQLWDLGSAFLTSSGRFTAREMLFFRQKTATSFSVPVCWGNSAEISKKFTSVICCYNFFAFAFAFALSKSRRDNNLCVNCDYLHVQLGIVWRVFIFWNTRRIPCQSRVAKIFLSWSFNNALVRLHNMHTGPRQKTPAITESHNKHRNPCRLWVLMVDCYC